MTQVYTMVSWSALSGLSDPFSVFEWLEHEEENKGTGLLRPSSRFSGFLEVELKERAWSSQVLWVVESSSL